MRAQSGGATHEHTSRRAECVLGGRITGQQRNAKNSNRSRLYRSVAERKLRKPKVLDLISSEG